MEAIGARLAEVRKRRLAVLLGLAAALAFVLVLGVALGAVYVPFLTSARILLSRIPWLGRLIHQDWTEAQRTIILSVRLPRVLLALLVGMALALAGTVFQGLFRNPMADPSIIGSSQGAALGATLAFFFGIKLSWGGLSAVSLLAFVGSLVAVLVVYGIARTGGRVSISSLLLVGIAVSSFLASIVSLLMVVSEDRMHNIFFWLMGGLTSGDWGQVGAVAPFIPGRRCRYLLLLARPQSHPAGGGARRPVGAAYRALQVGDDHHRFSYGGSGGIGLRHHRFRRTHHAPHGAPDDRARPSLPGAGVSAGRRLLPGAGRYPGSCPHRPQRTAGGHRHRLLRRALLHLSTKEEEDH